MFLSSLEMLKEVSVASSLLLKPFGSSIDDEEGAAAMIDDDPSVSSLEMHNERTNVDVYSLYL